MPVFALVVILTASALHAGANLLFKGSGDKEMFAVVMLWASALTLLPVLAATSWPGQPIVAVWPWLAGSVAAEVCHYVLLAAAYRAGDLSLVYPVARGTGVLVTPLWATTGLGEQVSARGWSGIALVVIGLVMLQMTAHRLPGAAEWKVDHLRAFGLAVGSGVCISVYNVLDKVAVSSAPVVPYLACIMAFTAAGLTCYLVFSRKGGRSWPDSRSVGLAVPAGIVTTVTYGLVLWGMTLTKVSYVAAARESSVLFATLFGVLVLGEGFALRRLAAAGVIGTGIACLAMAR